MKRLVGFLLLAVLIPACATEQDAILNDQNMKAGEYIEEHSVQPDIKQAGKDVKLNSKTLAKNTIGEAPKELQKPYTPENSQKAREDSDKSHAGGFWAKVGGAFLTGVLAVIALAKSPWAKMIPGVGTLIATLDGTMAAIETWATKMKEGGQPEVAAGLTSVLAEAHKIPAVHDYVEKRLDKIKAGVIAPKPEIQVATALAADAAVEEQQLATATTATPDPGQT